MTTHPVQEPPVRKAARLAMASAAVAGVLCTPLKDHPSRVVTTTTERLFVYLSPVYLELEDFILPTITTPLEQ